MTFAVGQQSRTITVLATGDNAIESDESFFVNLSGAVNAAIVTSQGTGTILNDDTVLPTISISDASRNEGNDPETTQFDFTVSLNFASTETLTVDYTTLDGTATTADSDYIAKTNTVTFLPGETEATISVTSTATTSLKARRTSQYACQMLPATRTSLMTPDLQRSSTMTSLIRS